jgi:RND family efflux transporter MFP subunit
MLGVCIAIIAVLYDNRPVRMQSPPIPVPKVPYSSFIAGAGIVEASTGNIAIGTPVSGIVMGIFVKVGDHVKSGDPLFKIDDRDLQGQLMTGLAKIKEAEASLQKPKHLLDYAEDLTRRDSAAISAQDMSGLRDETTMAEAALDLAKAQVAQIKLEIGRRTVRAAMAGEILQLKMRLGEYVDGGNISAPLLLLGGDGRLNVRVDIDEHDAWRLQLEEEALAFVQGHPSLEIALRYEYTEPYIVPKTALTGQTTERTDTRVLQVIYSFERDGLPVYVGQQLDVFIQAPPIADNTPEKRS